MTAEARMTSTVQVHIGGETPPAEVRTVATIMGTAAVVTVYCGDSHLALSGARAELAAYLSDALDAVLNTGEPEGLTCPQCGFSTDEGRDYALHECRDPDPA